MSLILLISEQDIQNRVKELASQISLEHPLGLHIIGILKGSWIFMADLVRQLKIPLTCDFIKVASYGQSAQSSGEIRIISDISLPIKGQDVLLLDDIVDTGLTLKFIQDRLLSDQPGSLHTCTLLDKPERRLVEIKIDYLGFTLEDKFVVGYGLDYAEQYRYLPDIRFIPEEALLHEQKRA